MTDRHRWPALAAVALFAITTAPAAEATPIPFMVKSDTVSRGDDDIDLPFSFAIGEHQNALYRGSESPNSWNSEGLNGWSDVESADAPVPLPASFWLLGAGLIAHSGGRLLRRKR